MRLTFHRNVRFNSNLSTLRSCGTLKNIRLVFHQHIVRMQQKEGNDRPVKKINFTKTSYMAIPVLDNEFMEYWAQLTVVEKESLLNVAKQYVELKKEDTDTDDLRKQLVMEERAKYLKGEGKSFSWDEVKDMAVNKEKRNGL